MESLLDSKNLEMFPTPESSIVKIIVVQTEKTPSWKKTAGGSFRPSTRRKTNPPFKRN